MNSEGYKPRCIHLSCKSMVVYGDDFENDPDFEAGLVDFQCTKTMKAQGPDGEDACLESCSNPNRSCFQEF
ncbi:MAG: hypothetical protein KatS3mg105_0632 [Gemmatales bacterium]|nr:MAG: hypothetical protein KatS3mg105_0632 [Gemmatales bacterium]